MIWDYFIFFGLGTVLLWIVGAALAWNDKHVAATAITLAGVVVLAVYIGWLWVSLSRPPMRTMGETRLLYSLFLPMAGALIYARWHYRWVLSFTTLLALVFVVINILKPEIHTKNLMPALQSLWFAPHVIVYMLAYAMFGAAFIIAFCQLFLRSRVSVSLSAADGMVGVGYALLTLGMLMGALWAKDAWGHYWSWDPKETWAAVTWLSYLVYIHYRHSRPAAIRPASWMLIVSFLLLQMCWWGINFLPSAQATSVHTYYMG